MKAYHMEHLIKNSPPEESGVPNLDNIEDYSASTESCPVQDIQV